VGGEAFEAVGFNADNFNGFSASTACLLAFNNPARRPQKRMCRAEGGLK
jgi:hypothetical protein